MGKATGFLDYERQDKKAEAPKERISHFREFHKPLTEEEQKKQGARCMDCGVPFGARLPDRDALQKINKLDRRVFI